MNENIPRKNCNDMILFETKVEIYFSLRLVHLAKTETYTVSGIVLNEAFGISTDLLMFTFLNSSKKLLS